MEPYAEEIGSRWMHDKGLLVTNLTGKVSLTDVAQWRESLAEAEASIPPGTRFRLIANLLGYTAVDGELSETHKMMRITIPELLLRHGFKPGYLDLFPDARYTITTENNVICVGAAHIHHDETKVTMYNDRFKAETREKFFTSLSDAYAWALSLPAP